MEANEILLDGQDKILYYVNNRENDYNAFAVSQIRRLISRITEGLFSYGIKISEGQVEDSLYELLTTNVKKAISEKTVEYSELIKHYTKQIPAMFESRIKDEKNLNKVINQMVFDFEDHIGYRVNFHSYLDGLSKKAIKELKLDENSAAASYVKHIIDRTIENMNYEFGEMIKETKKKVISLEEASLLEASTSVKNKTITINPNLHQLLKIANYTIVVRDGKQYAMSNDNSDLLLITYDEIKDEYHIGDKFNAVAKKDFIFLQNKTNNLDIAVKKNGGILLKNGLTNDLLGITFNRETGDIGFKDEIKNKEIDKSEMYRIFTTVYPEINHYLDMYIKASSYIKNTSEKKIREKLGIMPKEEKVSLDSLSESPFNATPILDNIPEVELTNPFAEENSQNNNHEDKNYHRQRRMERLHGIKPEKTKENIKTPIMTTSKDIDEKHIEKSKDNSKVIRQKRVDKLKKKKATAYGMNEMEGYVNNQENTYSRSY